MQISSNDMQGSISFHQFLFPSMIILPLNWENGTFFGGGGYVNNYKQSKITTMCLKLDVSWSNLKVKLNDLTAVTVQLIRECRTKFFTICTDGHINGGRLMSKFSNLTILAGDIDNLCAQNENPSEESWNIFKTSWGWAGPSSAANWDRVILWLTFIALYLWIGND